MSPNLKRNRFLESLQKSSTILSHLIQMLPASIVKTFNQYRSTHNSAVLTTSQLTQKMCKLKSFPNINHKAYVLNLQRKPRLDHPKSNVKIWLVFSLSSIENNLENLNTSSHSNNSASNLSSSVPLNLYLWVIFFLCVF